MDPQSLFPVEHRSVKVRQDLVAVRARDALVAARTQLINTTRGLEKSMGGRLPKCSSPSFPHKQEDSGDSQPQLRITKMGDMMLRRLLVGSAHYILGPFGPDTDLRRYGIRLSERGGKNAKKRAVGGGSKAGGIASQSVGERRGI